MLQNRYSVAHFIIAHEADALEPRRPAFDHLTGFLEGHAGGAVQPQFTLEQSYGLVPGGELEDVGLLLVLGDDGVDLELVVGRRDGDRTFLTLILLELQVLSDDLCFYNRIAYEVANRI